MRLGRERLNLMQCKGRDMLDETESVTAKLCSFARAYHSNNDRNKIFDDFLAYDIMGKDEYEEIGQLIEHDFKAELYDDTYSFKNADIRDRLFKYILPIPLSRAAFIEKEVDKFVKEHGRCQYVICGAGNDTFAFRNENPNIKVFEIDHPDTQRYKLDKIRELEWIIPENVKYVPVDFAKDDLLTKLIAYGFEYREPSVFAIPGVTYYLTLPVFEETLDNMSRIASKESRVIFDFPDETTFLEDAPERVKTLSTITEGLGEKMKHGYSYEEIKEALSRHSLFVDEHESPEDIENNYFKNRADNMTAFENVHFISAGKAEA